MGNPTIPLGSRCRDRITGFVGVVTGQALYLTGCNQALLAPPVDEAGKHVEAHWFDFARLHVVDSVAVTLPAAAVAAAPGPDKPAPIR